MNYCLFFPYWSTIPPSTYATVNVITIRFGNNCDCTLSEIFKDTWVLKYQFSLSRCREGRNNRQGLSLRWEIRAGAGRWSLSVIKNQVLFNQNLLSKQSKIDFEVGSGNCGNNWDGAVSGTVQLSSTVRYRKNELFFLLIFFLVFLFFIFRFTFFFLASLFFLRFLFVFLLAHDALL